MNSSRFTRFTPAHQPGDVFVRDDVVTSVQPNAYSGALFSGKLLDTATAINTTGGGTVIVKESPAQVIEALRAAENTHLVTVECVIEDGDTSSLADDCECNCGMTCCADEPDAADHAIALKEAQDDAKIADERAQWYKKLAEMLLAERGKAQNEAEGYKQLAETRATLLKQDMVDFDRISRERDSLLAKLKEATAALEKANAELNAARYGAFWNGDKYGYGKNGNWSSPLSGK